MQYNGRSSRNATKKSLRNLDTILNDWARITKKLETEMRKSGKYKFADPPSERPESEEDVFDSLVSVQLASEEFEIIETLAKSRGIIPLAN